MLLPLISLQTCSTPLSYEHLHLNMNHWFYRETDMYNVGVKSGMEDKTQIYFCLFQEKCGLKCEKYSVQIV